MGGVCQGAMEQKNTAPGKAEADGEHLVRSLQGTYPRKADIALQELFQNTGDAHGQNVEDGVIPEDRVVNAKMKIYPQDNAIEFTDKGAGGMSEDALNLVAKVGGSTKRSSGSGGGSFGLGLWMLTHLAEEGSGIYIESKYEVTGTTKSIALFNDTNRVLPDNPSQVRKDAGISNINSTTPSQWSVGGTLVRVEDVPDYVIEQLCEWEEVKEHLLSKFPFIDSLTNLNFDYIIGGEEQDIETPEIDVVIDNIKRDIENISVQDGDIENDIDNFIVFEAGTEKPWGDFVPLMKTRPGFEEPYLVVDEYKPSESSSIVNRNECLGAIAIIDTICDKDNAEEIAHNKVSFKPYRTDMKNICQEEHLKIVNENPEKYIELGEKDMMEKASSGIGDMTDTIYGEVDNPEDAGLEYKKKAEVSMSPCHEKDGVVGEVIIEKTQKFNSEKMKIRVNFEGYKQEGDRETVIEDARMFTIDENEDETSVEVCWDIEEEGSYYVECEAIDVRAGKIVDDSGMIVGVDKDVTSSNQRQAGATVSSTTTEEVEPETTSSEYLDLESIEVEEVVMTYSEEKDKPSLDPVGDEGEFKYELKVPINWPKLQDTLTLQKKDRKEEQSRLIENKVQSLVFMRLIRYTDGDMGWFDSMSEDMMMG